MQHEPYHDIHPEIPCPECGGAGFFGDGPIAETCDCCGGKGVLINEGAERKPMMRERRKEPRIKMR